MEQLTPLIETYLSVPLVNGVMRGLSEILGVQYTPPPPVAPAEPEQEAEQEAEAEELEDALSSSADEVFPEEEVESRKTFSTADEKRLKIEQEKYLKASAAAQAPIVQTVPIGEPAIVTRFVQQNPHYEAHRKLAADLIKFLNN